MDQISTNTMQENSEVFSQLIRQYSQTSVVIKQNQQYSGLYSFNPTKSSRFEQFFLDPLYKFPVLNATLSTNHFSKGIFSLSDFTQANTIDMKKSLLILKEKSPFKRGEFDRSLLYEVPNNSLNEESAHSFNLADAMAQDFEEIESLNESLSSLGSELPRREISADKKELIMQLHMNFAAKQDDRMLHSITPASSINLDQSSNSPPKVWLDSLSFQSDEVIFNPDNEEFSEILWEEKKKEETPMNLEQARESDAQLYILPITELIPEAERESSSLYNSEELIKRMSISSWEDEIPAENTDTFPTRVFLEMTASEHKLENCPIFPAFEKRHPLKKPSEKKENFEAEIPDLNSPLYRKLVLCYIKPESPELSMFQSRCNTVDIGSSIAVSSFSATPKIMFSNHQSKGYIDYSDNSPINTLFSLNVIRELTIRPILQVSLGFEHCLALTSGGQIFSWGYGASGCLGHGSTTTCSTPTLITAISEETIVYIESGAYHNAALTEKGEIWLWGRGDVQQLGLNFSSLVKDEIGYLSLLPIKNTYLSEIKQVACGEGHTIILNSEGEVFSFGWGEHGQLGYEIQSASSSIREIWLPSKVVKIGCGTVFSACLTEEGEIFTWGNNDLGQLGIGKISSQSYPVLVSLEEKALDFLCGESWVLCILSSGKVFGWGMGKAGEFRGNFPAGTDIACYKPHELSGVEIAHRYLLS